LHRQMLDVLGIRNYQKLVPVQEDMKPRDPVTENQNILTNKPVKAFLYQDHKAHIAVHMAAAQDPHIMQLVGQNPQMAQAISAALSAHVAEHLGMEYRKQMEMSMGQPLPAYKEDEDEIMMSPEMEVKVSQMAAMASQQLLQQHQQESQQQKAQQQAQDPLIQMQQQELQIKQADLQRKTQKDMTDAQMKQEQIQTERMRIAVQQQLEGEKLSAKTASEQHLHDRQQQSEGFRTAAEVHKHRQQLEHQREMREMQSQPKKKGD